MAIKVPEYTYTGMHTSEVLNGYWYIYLWSPGTFSISHAKNAEVCVIGGGAGGQEDPTNGDIGGHGGQVYSEAVSIQAGSGYAVDIGVGGQIGENGGTTTGFGLRAWGGGAGMGGAAGGGKGTDGVYPFGDSSLLKYGACGGGGGYPGGNGGENGGGNGATHGGASATAGTAGMGAGGGGGAYNATAAAGGAGCVIVRSTEDDDLPIIFNGTQISQLIYNGTTISSLIYNGTKIF